ncbi:hypothetical protein FRC01_004482 [Tulasnella sp. 417]|nr:hypothetical protein FRC01_004482 [Tulasnella sp. 417]
MDVVASHVHRWRTAVFKKVPKVLLPNESQQQQAPLLESLVFIMDSPNSTQNPFGGGQLPQLQYLYCQGASLPWSGGLLSGLSSLTIDNKKLQSITELDLAHILTSNPLLTALRIEQRRSDLKKRYPGTFPILHRPQLKSLELDLPGSLSDFVLRHVHAPECSRFGYRVRDGWEASRQSLVRFFHSTLSSASARPNLLPRLTIISEHRSLVLATKCDGEDSIGHPTFFASLSRISSARLLDWTVDHLLPSTNADLAITLWLPGGFPFKTKSQLQEFLRRLPPATDLVIAEGYKPDVLFDLLSVTLEDNESVNGGSFLLPGMKEITLYAPDCDWNDF